ncbi:MAG: hypothetical protein ACLP1X_03020 [Polyangiaceae bacterium]
MPFPLCRIARQLFEVGRVGVACQVLVACGSTGSPSAPGVDGSSAVDAAQAVDDAGDEGHAVDATDATDATGGQPGDGGTSLDGSMAFGVHYSVVYAQNLQVSCGYAPSPPTGYGDLVVLLTDVDLSSTCSSGTAPPSAGGHPAVRIEVESPSYATGGDGLAADGGPVAALTPGSYAIGFENQLDDDVCMLSQTSGTALVDVLDFGDAGCCSKVVGTSVSGTVTLTTVVTGHVVGHFQVSLAPLQGSTITTASAAPFGGEFDTTSCPGTTQ